MRKEKEIASMENRLGEYRSELLLRLSLMMRYDLGLRVRHLHTLPLKGHVAASKPQLR